MAETVKNLSKRQSQAIFLFFLFVSFIKTQEVLAQKNLMSEYILESDLSSAEVSGKKYIGSGVTSTGFVPTLTSYGTDLSVSEYYTEPDVLEITTYKVKKSDTLESIAKHFNISKNTIRWQNEIKSGKTISVGQSLIILPVTGVMHRVGKNDTLESIAKKYKGDLGDIQQFNDIISNKQLTIGMKIIIPNGERNEPKIIEKKEDTGLFAKIKRVIVKPFRRGHWNTDELIVNGYMHPMKMAGLKTQGYHHEWRAIDIGAPIGTDVYASMSGTVAIANKSGWGGGYGKYVLIKHNNGSITMYAHMNSVDVSAGESIGQGERLGESGNTGSSSGPHLHFEIRPPRGQSVKNWFPIPW